MPDLEDLYREIILDHYRNPRNRGELASPPAVRVEGFNPLCGDEVVVYLDVADGVVQDLKIAGQGCSISQSSASMMSAARTGLGRSEKSGARKSRVRRTMPPEVSDARPVRAPERSLRELADRLVETGMPWKRPAPVFASDCATDSWSMSIW